MGWASGGEVFDPVARELQGAAAPVEVRERVCRVLIDALQNRGWDTEGESLGEFQDDPAIVRAFKANGVVLQCLAEHETRPWQCEREQGHVSDHRDYQGNTWPNEDGEPSMAAKHAALDALGSLDDEGSIACGPMLEVAAETVARAVHKAMVDERNRGG